MEGYFRMLAELYGELIYPDGERVNLGLLSTKYITDIFAKYYIDCLQGLETGIADFKYHDSGIGTTAESVSDVGLESPTGIARAVGTQVEGASAITYRTVGTITYDGNYSITEWGLFNVASGGTLMDRAVFTARDVQNGYKMQFTYNHTALSGG